MFILNLVVSTEQYEKLNICGTQTSASPVCTTLEQNETDVLDKGTEMFYIFVTMFEKSEYFKNCT